MSAQPLIGEIMPWAPNFAPRSWAFCDGQVMAISQNQTLFSLIGTIYGGDGRTTFALPDLRGRAPVGAGRGPGLSDYKQGTMGGHETVNLTLQQMPQHSHGATTQGMEAAVMASSATASSATPSAGASLGTAAPEERGEPLTVIYTTAAPDTALAPAAVTGSVTVEPAGAGAPFDNRMPYLAIQYCIALEGLYPSRN